MKRPGLILSLAVLCGVALSGCGSAAKTVADTGKGFDRFACMSRNFKGEPPCPQPNQAPPKAE